jgi:hypothetical protein
MSFLVTAFQQHHSLHKQSFPIYLSLHPQRLYSIILYRFTLTLSIPKPSHLPGNTPKSSVSSSARPFASQNRACDCIAAPSSDRSRGPCSAASHAAFHLRWGRDAGAGFFCRRCWARGAAALICIVAALLHRGAQRVGFLARFARWGWCLFVSLRGVWLGCVLMGWFVVGSCRLD